MKAIFHWSIGLLSLLLLASASHGQIAYSPVFKTPLAQAPSPSNSGFYLVDAYGRLTGPHYNLMPHCPPFNGMLPGPIGQAIMSGNLPHELLLDKKAMTLGNVPLLGQKKGQGEHGGGSPAPMQAMNAQAPMAPYPMQMPYAQPMQMPYGQPMPPPQLYPLQRPNMPYTPYAPLTPLQQGQPIGYVPYYGAPGMVATAQRDPRTGIWQVQNLMPGQNPSPFMPIPGFTPGMQGTPTQNGPMMPGMMPMQPPMGPMGGFQPNGPIQQFDQFGRLQGPQPPQMNWQGMELPRMDMMPPPPQRQSPAYPTHPFTRSPRDFFMWGENMDEERARGNRPVPVP
jgi:hypothetical protein